MFNIIKNKKSYLALLTVATFAFSGCSDKKDEQTSKGSTASNGDAPQIQIVANDNAKEIKVETKQYQTRKKGQAKDYYYDYGEKSEYSQDAQPANKDASVRVRPRTVVDAYAHIRSPYERVQVSLIAKQLSSTFRLKCSACHDDYANGVLGPSLLGKDAEYIYNKIIEFKTGKKSNPLMTDLIKQMENSELKTLADEIYQFNLRVQKLRGKI